MWHNITLWFSLLWRNSTLWFSFFKSRGLKSKKTKQCILLLKNKDLSQTVTFIKIFYSNLMYLKVPLFINTIKPCHRKSYSTYIACSYYLSSIQYTTINKSGKKLGKSNLPRLKNHSTLDTVFVEP